MTGGVLDVMQMRPRGLTAAEFGQQALAVAEGSEP
jgi:hypothetical protein